jgi:hypothetical protein
MTGHGMTSPAFRFARGTPDRKPGLGRVTKLPKQKNCFNKAPDLPRFPMVNDSNSRIDLCRAIEAHRKRPLIVYVTSKREGAVALMSTETLPHIIEQLDFLPEDTKEVDFLIASYGGDPMVAWRIMCPWGSYPVDVTTSMPLQSGGTSADLEKGQAGVPVEPRPPPHDRREKTPPNRKKFRHPV